MRHNSGYDDRRQRSRWKIRQFNMAVDGNIRCTIAILVNNAFKTVQQSVKDKEDICRRTDAQQRYLTQDFIL